MTFPKWLALSPDGLSLYVSGQNSDSVAIFRRATRSQAFSQPSGTAGCVADPGTAATLGCASAPGLVRPQGLAVSPDGKHLYVAASGSAAIAAFARAADSGALTFVQCLSNSAQPASGCASAPGLAGASFATVPKDGLNVYVTAVDSNALTVYQRDQATGALMQSGCFVDASTPLATCTPVTGLKQPFTAATDGAGENVYVAARGSSAVTTFSRSLPGGSLTAMGCISGDRGYRQEPGCAAAVGMQYVQYVVPSPDDAFLYASATDSHAIGVFKRAADGALSQQAGANGCLQDNGYEPATPCRPAEGLALPLGIAFTPDGRRAYVAEFGYGTLTSYRRDASTGALTQVRGCLGNDPRCEPAPTLERAGFAALLDSQLFVTAAQSDAVNVLRPSEVVLRGPPPRDPAADLALTARPLRGQRLRRVLRRGLAVRVRCTRRCRVSAALAVARAAALRHHIVKPPGGQRKRVRVGRLGVWIGAQRTVLLRVRFDRRARSKLRRARRLAVWLTMTASDGVATVKAPVTRVTLRRPKGA
jgi:DNA-binding beta-propeller fold protein YncE